MEWSTIRKSRSLLLLIGFLLFGCQSESNVVQTDDETIEDYQKETEHSMTIESSFDQEDYHQIGALFADFELPEEGRITEDEAREQLPDNYNFRGNSIYYSNHLVFDKETKMVNDLRWLNFDRHDTNEIEPHGTQSIGFMMSIIEALNQHHYDVNGEFHEGTLEELNENEIQLINDEQFDQVTHEDVVNGDLRGWGALLVTAQRVEYQFAKIEPYIQDYNKLAAWSKETREFFETGKEIGMQSDQRHEEAYPYFIEGTRNIEAMNEELPQRSPHKTDDL
ncbi:hypothetical protein DH09_11565 [Bacillaceae bacterium JMAK1]|nr:hypothetical protein DH09_11565 [Bacillaceae bacterium JMAK1]